MAVLSAMSHGRDANVERAIEIAKIAREMSKDLDEERSKIYLDLIDASLSEAAQFALNTMLINNQYYPSDLAQLWVERGLAQGETKGRAALIIRLLTMRFGAPGSETEARLKRASIAALDDVGERLLTAQSLQEALDPLDGDPAPRNAQVTRDR